MGHYQPFAWLLWGAVDRMLGLTPAAAHVLNAGLHAACAALVFVVAIRIGSGIFAAVVAALLFALHPLRVEAVAWTSAMPYSLALLFALLSTLAFMEWISGRRRALLISVVCYAISLLARPIALGLPAVLFALRWWLERPRPRTGSIVRTLSPYAALAAVAAYFESHARATSSLSEVGIGPRLTLACTAPFRYLWRTIAPFNLTPLDAIALRPRTDALLLTLSAAGLALISFLAWRWREKYPEAVVACVSYLALLAPAMGLVPSGLQATADRYTYLAAVPLSIFAAGVLFRGSQDQRYANARLRGSEDPRYIDGRLAVGVLLVGASAVLTFQQMHVWHDSVALWTRAIEVDPHNDVALYNLASALAESGRRDDALARYEEVLRLIPDHRDAQRNHDLLQAAAIEDAANGLAASGRLEEAVGDYRRAIALDPARTHSQAALGMALVQMGRTAEALPHLREAVRLGAVEPAVSNALAFSLLQEGQTREACDVLQGARTRFPGDNDVRRNLEGLADECGRR
jgi:tetratricopeptide (TPR) repeat protein